MDRTVLIGLDGATWSVLDPLMASEEMPRLARLVASGSRAVLRSTAHPLTPPAWTSLVTGRTPGHHGIFDFIRAVHGDRGLYFTLNAHYDIRCETIWSIVSRHGGSVVSLNFPVHTPPPEINGYIVPGFVPWRHLRRAVHPRPFYDDMRSLPGFDARVLCMDMNKELKAIQYLPPGEHEAWITQHIDRERQWFGVAKALLDRGPADLFAVLFDGVDKLQHLCWGALDPALVPTAPTREEAQIREWCLTYFRELDRFIGEIVDAEGPTARIFIASDHGFGPTTDVFYANVWLEREGYLSWTGEMPRDEAGLVAGERIKSHVVGIDWERTTAYALTPSSNGIFIRRAERPGAPGVPLGDYEAFRRELAAKLLALRHPRTDAPVVRDVLVREEAFPGPAASGAADLTLVLHDYGFLSVLNADRIVWERPVPAGTHHPDGVFLAAGPGVAAGDVGELSIIDVAPALLHSLGMPVPADLEGRVPLACFEPTFLGNRPVVAGPSTRAPGAEAAPDGEMSREEQAIVMGRLQGLGYLE